MSGSVELENFIDELIRRAGEKGYRPTIFIGKRAELGTVEAIKKLVISGDIQSGFRRLYEIGLLEWSIEAAILEFPDEFTQDEQRAARWRLEQAGVDIGWLGEIITT